MLGLPKATELSKQLPKNAIYAKFQMNTAEKAKIDADISRITIVNEVSAEKVHIAAGDQVKSFFVLLVALKKKDFNDKTIITISKLIPQNITYNQIEGEYDSSIFTAEKSSQSFDKAFRAERAIQDYVFTDGSAEESVERRFVEDLDSADEVCVYAKLPKGFHIPTPVGNYSPDWAIAFKEGTVQHIFFVAETKGTMDSLNFRQIERAKISCAKKLFNEMSTGNVKYCDVDSYENLLNVMKSL